MSLIFLLAIPLLINRRTAAMRAEISGVVDPARDLVEELQYEIAREVAAARGFIITGDSAFLREIRAANAAEDSAYTRLVSLVSRLGPRAQRTVAEFGTGEARWSGAIEQLLHGDLSAAEYARRIPVQQALYQQANKAAMEMGHIIGQEARLRRAGIARTMGWGAVLSVLLSLLAMGSTWITVRSGQELHRRAGAAARRAEEEAALREVARVLTETFETHELLQRIADGAVHAAQGDGAFVERVDLGKNEVEVVACSGRGVPRNGIRIPYPGSLAEDVLTTREPELVPDLVAVGRTISQHVPVPNTSLAALVLPLISEGEALGALIVVREGDASGFDAAIIDRTRILSDLAAVALRRTLILHAAETLREEADAANRAKSQFLATMSHEIRTPVNAVMGYTDLLEMGLGGPLTERQTEFLGRIKGSSKHLLTLIDDILDFSKIETGDLAVRKESTRLGGPVADAINLVAPMVQSKGLTLSEDKARRGDLTFFGDADRVRQILVNLLSNAVKFTAPGGHINVRCHVWLHGEPEVAPHAEGPWTCVEVEDTGTGIAPAQLDRIFEPFYQAESGYTREQGGTGLGLAISRTLARMMDGEITVWSEPGVGSCFTLWLRAADDKLVELL